MRTARRGQRLHAESPVAAEHAALAGHGAVALGGTGTGKVVALRPGSAELDFSGRPVAGSDLGWFYRHDPGRRWLRGSAFRAAKRAFDLAAVILSAPVSVPLAVLCAIAIRLERPFGPALFVQERTGLKGRRFPMFKFRTMVPGAEEMKAGMAFRNKLHWPDFKVENDPRVTFVGRILRRTSLDELPQLLNVLTGDMSLVGPRPTSFGAETYTPEQRGRLDAIPGLTGLWQVCGRGEMEFDERARLDIAYIERQSMSLDLEIILRTVGAVLARKGAY